MNKKILIFLLTAVLVFSCVALIACNANVVGIKFKADTLPVDVKRNDTIDYSTVKITVTYDDGTTKELSLTDKSVSYEPIDTSTTGNKTLTATFASQHDQATINVRELNVEDYTVTAFENSDGYVAYKEAVKEKPNNTEIEFFDRETPYTVGYVNGYKFVPKTTVTDGTTQIINDNVKTTYALSVKGSSAYEALSGANLTRYLSKVENNVYYFTEEAANKQFKLDVTLDGSYDTILDSTKKTVSQEFVVVNGYNVYDALGLSVLDNLNVKSWASIKNTTLDWDSKPLSQYGDVFQVVLHNNIEVTKSDLPANYFWTVGETAVGNGISYADALGMAPQQLKHLLPGSLKETCLGEDWENGAHSQQRGLYSSDGIGISGNYLTLSYKTGFTVSGEGANQTASAPNGGIYIVHDFNQETNKTTLYPESHYNFVFYKKTNRENTNPTISNVYFVGQTKKTEATGIPAGVIMLTTEDIHATVNNVIGSQWFANVDLSGDETSMTMSNCKLYDSFSQMIYSWYGKSFTINHSELKRAGGPLVIMTSAHEGQDRSKIAANIDEYTVNHMENWLTGNEVWFTINLGNEGNTVVPQLLGLSKALGEKYYKESGSGDDKKEMYNVLMVLIPTPGDIFDNQHKLGGQVTVGEDVYSMDDSVLALAGQLSSVAGEFVTLVNSLPAAVTGSLTQEQQGLLNMLKEGAAQMQTSTASLPFAPIYKSGDNYAYTADMVHLNFSDIIAGVKQLSFGASTIADLLKGAAAQYQAGGDAATAQALTALAAQFTAWANKVNPIANLVTVADKTPLDDDFGQAVDTAWKNGWNSSPEFAAVWVNPGGLKPEPDVNIKPFMVVFGAALAA